MLDPGIRGPPGATRRSVRHRIQMYRTVSPGYAERIAERMEQESQALAADWLTRLDSLLAVDVNAILPSTQLLDHVPLLIRHVADYLRAPADLEIAADTHVIE